MEKFVGRFDAIGRQLVEAGALHGHQPDEFTVDRRAGFAPFAHVNSAVQPAGQVGDAVGRNGPLPDLRGEFLVVEGHPFHFTRRGPHRAQQHLGTQLVRRFDGKIDGQTAQHEIVGTPEAGVEIPPERLVAHAARTENIGKIEAGRLAQLGLGGFVERGNQAGQLGQRQFTFEVKGVKPADQLNDGRRRGVRGDIGQDTAQPLRLHERMRIAYDRACSHVCLFAATGGVLKRFVTVFNVSTKVVFSAFRRQAAASPDTLRRHSQIN